MIVHNITRGSVLAERLDVASSFWARFRGLMGRPSLPAGSGLFLAGNGIHMFFMRFAIDAVFVSGEDGEGGRRVVAIREGLRPWTGIVPLIRGAAAVLELPTGTVAGTGTRLGDTLVLEADSP